MELTDRQAQVSVPQKTREMQNWICDSTRWNDFEYRDGDIVIGTWSKAGTTWLQQIVGQLVFEAAEGIPVFDVAAWVDMRIFPKDEMLAMLKAQTHRRFMKTHLPVDALMFSPQAKYIYIGRDGRDVLWSWYNHHANFSPMAYEMMNETPGLVGPKLEPPCPDIRKYFHDWLDKDGFPVWPFWPHIQSWWDIRHLDNVLLVHFVNLKSDLEAQMRRIAAFLDIELDETLWPAAVEHCTFDYMKEHASVLSSHLDRALVGGARAFVHKGTNDRWRDVLTPSDIEKYERLSAANLSPDCAHWLATGELPD